MAKKSEQDAAWEKAFYAHSELIFRIARRALGGDSQLAEDCVIDVFALAFLKKVDPNDPNLVGWLVSTVRNIVYTLDRDNRNRARILTTWVAPLVRIEAEGMGRDLESAAMWAEFYRCLLEALAACSEAESTTFVLREMEGLTVAAIATKTGVSPTTVKNRLQKSTAIVTRALSSFAKEGVSMSSTPTSRAAEPEHVS